MSQNSLQQQNMSSGSTAESGTRTSNAMKIQMKKAQMRAWPKEKKIEKIACYSACRVSKN